MEKGKWGCPTPADSVLGLLTTWQGEEGPQRGRWGLSPLFSLLFNLFLSPFLTQKHAQNPIFQILSLSLIDTYTTIVSLTDTHTTILFLGHTNIHNYSLSLSVHPFSLPHSLSALGSVETPALPYLPEMPKMGTQLLDR